MTYSLFHASKQHNIKQKHTESVSKMMPRLIKQGAFVHSHKHTKKLLKLLHMEASNSFFGAHTHRKKTLLRLAASVM